MIALAVAAMAAISQAATVNWKAPAMNAAGAADGTVGSSVWGSTGHKGTMYVYYFDTLDAYNAAQALTAKEIYDTYGSGTATGLKGTKSASALGETLKLQSQPDGTDVKPVTIYGMALFVDTDSAASYANVDAFIKTDFRTASYQDANGTDFLNLGSGSANWTAVAAPEPTSGLLLLLGMAGLALKRKRA